MNNAKTFIVFALILGAAVAVAQIFVVFFNGTRVSSGVTAESINLLPSSINVEQLTTFTERASKYLLLTPKQFEDGVDPASLGVTDSPTPTPTL